MGSPYTCDDCGEWCDGHAEHFCSGTPGDRLDALESTVVGLEEKTKTLEARIAALEKRLRRKT